MRAVRRPYRRHQPVPGRRHRVGQEVRRHRPDAGGPARRAGHHRGEVHRTSRTSRRPPGTRRRDPRLRPGLHPRQARRGLLPKIFESLPDNNVGTSSTSAATTRPTPPASSPTWPARRPTNCVCSTFPRPSTTTSAPTDHCPGYGSAARFVAAAFQGDDRDNAALPGIKINVIMGRNAGWLTAAERKGR